MGKRERGMSHAEPHGKWGSLWVVGCSGLDMTFIQGIKDKRFGKRKNDCSGPDTLHGARLGTEYKRKDFRGTNLSLNCRIFSKIQGFRAYSFFFMRAIINTYLFLSNLCFHL